MASAVNMDVVAVAAAVDAFAEMEALYTVVDIAMMDHLEEKAHLYPLHYLGCPSFLVVAVDNYPTVAALAAAAEVVEDVAVFVHVMDDAIGIALFVDHHCEAVVAVSPSHHHHRQYNQRVLPDMVL